jgi:murein L,D-transpeptidase YcbB/YkuD
MITEIIMMANFRKGLLPAMLSLALLHLSGCSSVPKNAHVEAQKLWPEQNKIKRLAGRQWQPITTQKLLKPKQSAPEVVLIRHRLAVLGDLPKTADQGSTKYDEQLLKAVKQFQYRHGLDNDGVIGKDTLAAMNVSPAQRLQQLKQSIQAWQQLPKTEVIHVNLASYQLNIFKNNDNPLQMKVVVGSDNWPTPELQSEVKSVVVNPKWHVPRNITEKELIHKIVKDQAYLEEEHIKIYDGWHKGAKTVDPQSIDWQRYAGEEDLPYRLIQSSGDHNALGRIKFTFPNKEHVYLHDTPYKSAFSLVKRNLSHGCIRLQQPMALLSYLQQSEHLRGKENISQQLEDGKNTRHYALAKPVPIIINRISAWVDKFGLLNFR